MYVSFLYKVQSSATEKKFTFPLYFPQIAVNLFEIEYRPKQSIILAKEQIITYKFEKKNRKGRFGRAVVSKHIGAADSAVTPASRDLVGAWCARASAKVNNRA